MTFKTLHWQGKVALIWIATIAPISSALSLRQNRPRHIGRNDNPVVLLDRRSFLVSTSSLVALAPIVVGAVVPPEPRNVDVGGGFDLLSTDPRRFLSEKDAFYPSSMEGVWNCQRVVAQIDGDSFQAESAWRCLGGSGSLKVNALESFSTRYISSTATIGNDGGVVNDRIVNDRGFEMASRRQDAKIVSWNVEQPDALEYDNATKLLVVQRSVELPSDQGFGFNELIRIDDGPIMRAAKVKRRYRRAFDENGNRVVEGLEIMKTFRVLDGIAGTEFPTSTTKSQIRMTRPL
jgi:hypothetical protein